MAEPLSVATCTGCTAGIVWDPETKQWVPCPDCCSEGEKR